MQDDDPLVRSIIEQSKKIYEKAYINKYKVKPKQNETVICSFSIINKNINNIKTISVGFGTKSLPYSLTIDNKGIVIKDMHAQMLARRGFIQYIVSNLPNKGQDNQLFEWNQHKQKHQLHTSYTVVLYCNQIFCGDCMTNKSSGLYSGARPLKYFLTKQPPQQQFNEHFLRTKPGRIDLPLQKRSLSLSCSDKIGLWNILGLQGKRLFNHITPIYLNTIIIQTIHKIPKSHISKGINLPYRISKLRNFSKNKIITKLFKIVINSKTKLITHQFQHHKPTIILINKPNCPQLDKKLQNCGIICNNQANWLCGKTGLPEGVNINKINKISPFCTQYLFANISINQNQQFKYHAIKSRIKLLFRQWTDAFKTNHNNN